jgi:hypothetical protein
MMVGLTGNLGEAQVLALQEKLQLATSKVSFGAECKLGFTCNGLAGA